MPLRELWEQKGTKIFLESVFLTARAKVLCFQRSDRQIQTPIDH